MAWDGGDEEVEERGMLDWVTVGLHEWLSLSGYCVCVGIRGDR